VPRPSFASRWWRVGVALLATALLLGWLAWFVTTPEELVTSDRTITANGVVGTPLYVGVYGAAEDRTLRLSGVKVHATSSADLTITPVLCRRGTVGVTTDPDEFCAEVVNPEGQRLSRSDSIALKIESEKPVLAVISRIRIAYREDIRWDTQPAGYHQAIVSIAGRPETDPTAPTEPAE